jgi:hypothetical protein
MGKLCWRAERKTIQVSAGQGRAMIKDIRQGLIADGFEVSISKQCRWLELSSAASTTRQAGQRQRLIQLFSNASRL